MHALVISANGFSKILNNGKTLESVFSKFKKDELSQVITRPQNYIDFDFCNSFYLISELQVIKNSFNKKICGEILTPENNITFTNSTDRIVKYKKNVSKSLRDILPKSESWKNEAFKNWILSQAPDIIFLVGGSRFLHNIAKYVKNLINKPLAIYFTDDYIIYPEFKGITGKAYKKRLIRSYRELVSESSLCFAIGNLMCEEYTKFFNKPFIPIMNSVPFTEYKLPQRIEGQPISISYFGGLHLNRWQMIARLGSMLPKGTIIKVYTTTKMTDNIKKVFELSNIKLCPSVQGEDLYNAMCNTDILLHIESDDMTNRRLTRLSVSTKIPEYLMAGRCIIGYGPQEVASMKELKDNNVGFIIDSSQSDVYCRERLQDIIEDYGAIIEIGKRGHEFAKIKYDGGKNAQFFHSELNNVIK